MAILRDPILEKLLNSAAYTSVRILDLVRRRGEVTVAQIESVWEQLGGREIKRSGQDGKRVIDNTVRNHMQKLCDQGFLEREKRGKEYVYVLGEEASELHRLFLEAEDIRDLLRWAETLSAFDGFPFYEDLLDIIGKDKDEVMKERGFKKEDIRPVIDFETGKRIFAGDPSSGAIKDITKHVSELLRILYRLMSAKDRRTIAIDYKRFDGSKRKFVELEPYLLKEHNRRWYLVAFSRYINKVMVFSLDRMLKIYNDYEGHPFEVPNDFDPQKFWKYSVGIIPSNEKPITISFELKDGVELKNVDYLISLPIHPSQQVERIDDTWTKFTYTIESGPELVRAIRQWGIQHVRNIQPDFLDQQVREG